MSALVAVLCASVTPPVWGQASKSAAAQGLFDEAKALMAAGKARDACPKLEESQRLDPASGTLANLGRCYEQTGRIASAWTTYLEAAAAAHATGNTVREQAVRERAAALAPLVSKLAVQVPPEAHVDGLSIHRDGLSMGKAQWGVPVPVDEGEHVIVAAAPGHAEWRSVVEVRGQGKTVEVSVPELEPIVESITEAVAPSPAREAPVRDEPSQGLGMQKALALTVGGLGLVGVGVGTGFGVKMLSNKNEADRYCDGTACTDVRGVSAGKDAHSAGTVATVAMVVGAASLATGFVLWLTTPTPTGPEVGVGLGEMHVRGTW